MKKIMYLLVFSFMFFLGTDYASAKYYSEGNLGIIGTRCYYRNSNGDLSMVVQKNDSKPDKSTIYLLKGYTKDQYDENGKKYIENQDIYATWENIDTPEVMKNGSCPDTLAYTMKKGSNKFEFYKTEASIDTEYILYNHNLENGKNRCVYSITSKSGAEQIFYYVDNKTAIGYKLNGSNFQLIYQDYVYLDNVSYNIFDFSNFLSSYKQNGGKCPDIYVNPNYQGLYVDSEDIPENSSKIYYNSALTNDEITSDDKEPSDDKDEEDSKEENNSKSLYFNYNDKLLDGITSPFTVQVVLDSSNMFFYRVYFNGNKPSLDGDLQKVDGFTYIVNHDNKTLYFSWCTDEECIKRLQRAFDDVTGTYKLQLYIAKVSYSANNEYLITPIEEEAKKEDDDYIDSGEKDETDSDINPDDDHKFTDHSNDVSCGSVYNIPKELPKITNIFINFVKIFTPLILIFKGMMDLFKAVTSSKQDEISKAKNKFFKRLIPAIVVFLVVLLTQFIFGIIATNNEASTISECINCFLNNNCSPNINN